MLNLFGKKTHQETLPTKYPAKSKPKTPKDSPRIHHSPKLILTPDSTKGIAYNSARISRPNGVGGISTSGSSSPTTEFVTPQASKSSVDQNKKKDNHHRPTIDMIQIYQQKSHHMALSIKIMGIRTLLYKTKRKRRVEKELLQGLVRSERIIVIGEIVYHLESH